MAGNNEDDIRRRYRDRERGDDDGSWNKKKSADASAASTTVDVGEDYIKKLNELLERAEPLIHAVNSSFNNYAQGFEIRPPTERYVQLEQMMNTLMMMAKPTPAYRFRFQNVHGTYLAYKKKWDKLVADIDAGRIARKTQPMRRAA